MNFLCNRGFVRKILIVLIVTILVNFTVPIQSHADDNDFGGKLFKPVFQFLAAVADIPVGLLHHFMLDTDAMFDSVTIEDDDINVTEYDLNNLNDIHNTYYKPESTNVSDYQQGIWYSDKSKYNGAKYKVVVKYGQSNGVTESDEEGKKYSGYINDDGFLLSDKDMNIPNILYCPEYIFSNRIAALDVNFINPGEFTNGNKVYNEEGKLDGQEAVSIASQLTKTVSSWYRALRNVAIVGLLSVLLYVGIRIIIGSTALDKAKYKERLKDWVVGLCLLFAMHYIMAGVMMINETITENLSKQTEEIHVKVEDYQGKDYYFKTNYMGYIRFMVQSSNAGDAVGFLIMYIALVIFTIMFTIIYLKRVLYMAFFTIIAPLVAMTYPIDKLSDGHAQGFNIWFREYLLNALIQPVHLVLYLLLIGSVMDLAISNVLYGVVALAFLLPAEKFVKKMFRFDKGETTSTLGAVAGGALAMKGVQSMSRFAKGSSSSKNESSAIRTKDNSELNGKRGRSKDYKAYENALDEENNALNPGTEANNDEGVLNVNNVEGASADSGIIGGETEERINTPNVDQNQEPDDNSHVGDTINMNDSGISADLDNSLDSENDLGLTGGNEDTDADTDTDNEEISTRRRFKNVGVSLLSRAQRGIERAPERMVEAVKRKAIKLPRTAFKLATTVGGAVATGAISAGAAVTTGDAKTAASMIGTGTIIGANLGRGIGNRVANKTEKASVGILETAKDAWYTSEDREKQKAERQEKFDEDWKQKEENYAYLLKKKDIKNNEDAKKFLNHDDTKKFLKAGVTDINTIYNARKLREKAEAEGRNMTIEGAIARARIADKMSDNFKDNISEQNSLADGLKRDYGNLDAKKFIEDIKFIKKKED